MEGKNKEKILIVGVDMCVIYSNKIVLEDEVVKGYLVLENGLITEIVKDKIPNGDYLDYTDKYVLPGFVNLSSINYSKEAKSYYNKYFSEDKILRNLDRLAAQSGVTTLFHTFDLHDLLEGRSIEDVVNFLEKIKSRNKKSLVDHKIHILINVDGERIYSGMRELILNFTIDLITFKGANTCKKSSYKNQYFVQNVQSKFKLDDDKANDVMELLINSQEDLAIDDISYRIKTAKNTDIKFASSVINIIKKLDKRYNLNIDMIIDYFENQDFDFIRNNNIKYIYDIDNLESDDNVLKFLDLLLDNTIYALSSSERYNDILEYIFALEGSVGLNRAVNLFSLYPAIAVGMKDRGSINVGKQADLVIVSVDGERIFIDSTFTRGNTVVKFNYEDTF